MSLELLYNADTACSASAQPHSNFVCLQTTTAWTRTLRWMSLPALLSQLPSRLWR